MSVDSGALEALLFSTHHPLTATQIADVLGLPVSKGVKQAVSTVAGVTDFDAHYGEVLNAVRGEIAQGLQLGVRGTPTFFLNGIRLPIWPAYVFQAAIESELRRASTK